MGMEIGNIITITFILGCLGASIYLYKLIDGRATKFFIFAFAFGLALQFMLMIPAVSDLALQLRGLYYVMFFAGIMLIVYDVRKFFRGD
jgi:hypothetical protein